MSLIDRLMLCTTHDELMHTVGEVLAKIMAKVLPAGSNHVFWLPAEA